MVPTNLAPDCRHYRGDRPCVHNRLCAGCSHYAPFAQRICIIKLGALGDVIRTLCILPELRRQFPNAQITWVSLPNGCRMIAGHPMIDRVLTFSPVTAMALAQETFDIVISLDKEAEPCSLATSLWATRKLGVGLSAFGTPVPLNPQADHYFALGLSDQLKFHENTKSYPQLVYEGLGFQYRGQRYELPLNDAAKTRVAAELASKGWKQGQTTLGINVGAGKAFANKMWSPERQVEVIRELRSEHPNLQIVLLGGPDERAALDQIAAATSALGGVFDGGTNHDEPSFVALVSHCDVLFAGDTMAMHVAVALGKHVVAVFGPTCEQEIDLFGRGEKLVAQVACSPCYKRACDQQDACVKHHEVSDATAAIGRAIAAIAARSDNAAPPKSFRLNVLPAASRAA